MNTCDVLVIGGGPAGAAAAYTLALRGVRVLILDKAHFPRDKTCGDGLTPRALAALDALGLLPALLKIGCRVNGVAITAPNGRTHVFPVPGSRHFPDYGLVVPRFRLDALLLEHAQAHGAAFAGGVHAQRVEAGADGVAVRTQGGVVFRAQVALIATGASTGLLANSGLLGTRPALIMAARAYFDGVEGLRDHFALTFRDVPLPGYGWVFPVGEGRANIGIGFSEDSAHPPVQRALQTFVGSLGALRRARQDGPPKSYPIRTDFTGAPLRAERVLLAGEAAGLVNPLTGDGIDYALESGRLAGEAAAAALASGDWSFAGYERRLRAEYQSWFSFCELVRRRVIRRRPLNWLSPFASRYHAPWALARLGMALLRSGDNTAQRPAV